MMSTPFTLGGRSELQFNIGRDRTDNMLRHGVAFSFETSRALPTIDPLIPKVRLFNEYLRLYLGQYDDMRMWHWYPRSNEYMPGAIPPELVRRGVFVFLGKRLPIDQLDYELILDDFDRLLPLYEYIESSGASQPVSMPTTQQFSFQPGCSIKAKSASVAKTEIELDVSLRHNLLQEALYNRLAAQFGLDNVGTERPSGVGTRIDLVVRQPDAFWFYEIKTAQSPRACIREALSQLPEYAFWPGAQEAARLVVVGETPLDKDGDEYLQLLRRRFSLPIHYEQITL
jgi:hypothetical protein